ncbi:hypothetical protein [Lacisediminimonas profundi]|uniref:hypothetical protein n=1 Tax=Lacisediminimonas profundi TaxID=2603856 RepID=UPI001386F850|nr:hypothetical protein [Lacisediminimonas profundi]
MNALPDQRSTRQTRQASSCVLLRMQPKHLIRYAPHPVHSHPVPIQAGISALFYIEHRSDVFGWYAQAKRARYGAAFFMIENFYSDHATSLFCSVEDDVYGQWRREMPPSEQEIRCPVPELLRHELERLQSAFIDEWLFFTSDPMHPEQSGHYRACRLPLQAFNVQSRRLGHLDRSQPVWSHQSAGSNPDILDFLQKCWRFYRKALILSFEPAPFQAIRRYDEVDTSSTKKGRN